MTEHFWGGSVEYDIGEESINNETDVHHLLDKICTMEKLTALHGKWNKLSFEDGSKLLVNALNFDLAYSSGERMPYEKAKHFQEQILSRLNADVCECYTNWFQNPWKNENGASWNPVTRNTFDMAVILFDRKKLVFTYVISED